MTSTWIFYPESGAEPIVATPERWAWVALNSDGTFLEQFSRDGTFHQFREIDQERLIGIQMVNLLGNRPPIVIHWKPGRKLIHFYRTIRLNVGTPNEIEIRLYCFGYETRTDKMIAAIMPDDQIRILEDIEELKVV